MNESTSNVSYWHELTTSPHGGVHYQDFLAHIAKVRETELYLEVGVQCGFNFSKIEAKRAIGVDPKFDIQVDVTAGKEEVRLFRLSSDVFFRRHSLEVVKTGVDLAFLDGMHLFEYLLRDFYNTEKISTRDCLITLHDCMPFNGEMIEREFNLDARAPGDYSGFWTGDVWKVVCILKKYRPDLKVQLVNCHPTGIVCVTGANRNSRVLEEHYLEIVEEFHSLPNDMNAIKQFYQDFPVTRAEEIVNGFNHSLYFRR